MNLSLWWEEITWKLSNLKPNHFISSTECDVAVTAGLKGFTHSHMSCAFRDTVLNEVWLLYYFNSKQSYMGKLGHI